MKEYEENLKELYEFLLEYDSCLSNDEFMFRTLTKRDQINYDYFSKSQKNNIKKFIKKTINYQWEKYKNIKDDILNEEEEEEEDKNGLERNVNKYKFTLDKKLEKKIKEETKELENELKVEKFPPLSEEDKNKIQKEITTNKILLHRNKMLKVVNKIEIIHPTLKSINLFNMIHFKSPLKTISDSNSSSLLFSPLSNWNTWSSYNIHYDRAKGLISIPTYLQMFVMKEFFNNYDENITNHSDLIENEIKKNPVPIGKIQNPYIIENEIHKNILNVHKELDYVYNKDIFTQQQELLEKIKDKFNDYVNEREIQYVKKWVESFYEIALGRIDIDEEIIKFIDYKFTGQYVPYHSYDDSNNDGDKNENKSSSSSSKKKSKFFNVNSLLLEDPKYKIIKHTEVFIIFLRDEKKYVGIDVNTGKNVKFHIFNEGLGNFAEQILSTETKYFGIVSRLLEIMKQKPLIVTEKRPETPEKEKKKKPIVIMIVI